MKKSMLVLAFFSMMLTSSTVNGTETSTDKVGASGRCLGYLSMFNVDELQAKPTRTRELLHLFKSSLAEAMQTSSIRKAIDSGFFAKSGAELNNDFYEGFILAGIFEESTKKIKDKIPKQEITKLSFAELKQRWGEEAAKAYASENCELIK